MIDPVLGGIIVAGITSAASVAGTLQVQRHTAKREKKDDQSVTESSRISDIRAFYDQLLKDRDARIAELRADLLAVEADLRTHNENLAKNNDMMLRNAAAQEQTVAMLADLLRQLGA